MNVLITSAGQRVSLVKAFQEELKSRSREAKVLTVDLNPSLAPACHVADGYFSVPRVSDKDYIPQLLNICLENNIQLVVPTIDTELLVLSKHKEFFKAHGITVVVSDVSLIERCRDKRLTNALFGEYGIAIPRQYEKTNLIFPVFAKPCDGSLSKGIFVAHSEDQITDAHLNNEKLMFMEYISPSDYEEFTVDCYFDRHSKLKCVVPRKRIFIRAGEINKGVTKKNRIVSEFKQKLAYVEGAIGCLTIQVFSHKVTEEILAIEINPRFGGGYPLSYFAGANYPQWLIQEYIGQQEIYYFEDWKENLLMLRYDAEVLIEDYEK